jgi:hypothetical protein
MANNQVPERDADRIAYELISEYGGADKVGRLRAEIARVINVERARYNKLREAAEKALSGLIRHTLITGPCWCPSRVSAHGDWLTPGEHGEQCDKARAFYEELKNEALSTTRNQA